MIEDFLKAERERFEEKFGEGEDNLLVNELLSWLSQHDTRLLTHLKYGNMCDNPTCDVCHTPITGVGALSPSLDGPRQAHPDCLVLKEAVRGANKEQREMMAQTPPSGARLGSVIDNSNSTTEQGWEEVREKLEELFPKGVSEERGPALVLHAFALLAHEKILAAERAKLLDAVKEMFGKYGPHDKERFEQDLARLKAGNYK